MPIYQAQGQFSEKCVLLLLLPSSIFAIELDQQRYPIGQSTQVTVAAANILPPGPLFFTLRRDAEGQCFSGRSTSPGDDGINCYANWALRLPRSVTTLRRIRATISRYFHYTDAAVSAPVRLCVMLLYPRQCDTVSCCIRNTV